MPLPRHTVTIPHVQLKAQAGLKGVTELRVHGVSGTPPDAVLGDLTPEQVAGDATAGFWRSGDHQAAPGDQDEGLDVDRHVEVFSWGGLTSGSKLRVLWLALLPFLLANLAGWMCPPRTRRSGWRFQLHRLAHGLCALALTVNAALIALLISADICGYQTPRAGIAHHQWWLAPLNWPYVEHHPARQVTVGVLVVVLFILALVWLASRTWRYEAVRPPYRVSAGPAAKSRAAADTLPDGLADQGFWDGEGTVRLLTWLHVAAAGGFAAIMLGVTTRALAGGSPKAAALGWAGVVLGAVTLGLTVVYLVVEAANTPDVTDREAARSGRLALADRVGRWIGYLLVPAGLGLVCSVWCAWRQPGTPSVRAADLPGMAGVTGWTALAIAVAVALALVSMLLGLGGRTGTLIGGTWVTLMLAFGALNVLLLGAEIWVAHLVGPVTAGTATALSARPGQIYLSRLVSSGMPLLFWALVLAIAAFAVVELARWLATATLLQAGQYEQDANRFRVSLARPLADWYQGPPLATDRKWQRRMARTQFLAGAPHDAGWLLWTIVAGQLVMAWAVWRLHLDPPLVVRDAGIALAGLVLPALMAYLYAAWSDLAKRRTVGILWDVGTFWPRAYHPLSPPCYSERAVPDLQRRLWWLHDNGGRVMLTAHSQGTVLAAAALAQPQCRPCHDQTALVTFGSPLVKLYQWGFPAWFGPDLLGPLVPGQAARVGEWRNFVYPTDPIGGPVAAGLPPGPELPVDQPLLDPAGSYHVYGQPAPAPGGHSGYWSDQRVWAKINAVAARLFQAGAGVSSNCSDPDHTKLITARSGNNSGK